MAQNWLAQKGLTPLTRNYRCKAGELDLLMLDNNTLAFIEVRFRAGIRFGGAGASVDFRKQQKILRSAQHFLLENPRHANRICRFDVIAASENKDGTICFDWIQNAFQG